MIMSVCINFFFYCNLNHLVTLSYHLSYLQYEYMIQYYFTSYAK